MDSFCDVPRRPPQPIPRETFPATPVVPEISVLCPSNTPRNAFTPYNQWKKDAMQTNFLVTNKENITGHLQSLQNNSILKKQVRFESPVLHQRSCGVNELLLNKTEQNSNKNKLGNDGMSSVVDHSRAISNFEQMYMANIPNRQLDLSVIDLPKGLPQNEDNKQYFKGDIFHKEPVEKEQPKTYRDYLESQKDENKVVLNDSVIDIFNYKRNFSPKHSGHKIGVEGGLNMFQQITQEQRHHQKENNERKEPKQSQHAFQHISEAISQRKLTAPFETTYTQGRGLKTNNRNQDGKNSPQEIKNDLKPKKGDTEDTENMLESQTTSSSLGYISDSLDSSKSPNYPVNFQKNRECCTQTSNDLNKALEVKGDDDFSVKDLLKIITQQSQHISQQNEQLLLLQKQVTMLIGQQKANDRSRQKSIQFGQERICCQDKNYYDRPRHCCRQEPHCEQIEGCSPVLTNVNVKNIKDRCITSTHHEDCNGMRRKLEATPKKNNLPNFSIGLTTSFEVSFKRPHYGKNQNELQQKSNPLPNFDGSEPPKIQEITETAPEQGLENCLDFQNRLKNAGETLVDESMIFKEPIQVRESCPSPEPSIKINMKDFEDSDLEDDLNGPEIGPSFYRNLMVQVNKILQKAQIETTEEVGYNFKGRQLKQNTLHKVQEATLKHLRRIGVEVQNSEDSSQSDSSSEGLDNKSYNQEDISFAVKQLLMKYLPADHLAKIVYKEAQLINGAEQTPKDKIGAIKTRSDFSFATVQYMKKYNLIANNQKDFCQAAKQNLPQSPKILDITKLKQQPKLL